MEIGFIGLGSLGSIMVNNLLEKERNIHLFNRTQEKMQAFENRAVLHKNATSIANTCDVVISIVSDDIAIQALSYGDGGLVQNMKPGSVHICLSTISPSCAGALNKAYTEKQIDYITATIIGRPEAARARSLIICVSGTSSKMDLVTEILKELGGKDLYFFGNDPKTAAVVKICNNFLIISAIEAIGEAFTLAEKAGVDTGSFYKMITETLFNAPIYKSYGKIIMDGSFEKAGFTAQLGLKDIKLALALADEVSMPLPLADLTRNRLLINRNRGRNGHDWTSVAKVIEEESGLGL